MISKPKEIISYISAQDIIEAAKKLKEKNLSQTPVKLKVYDSHIVITDQQDCVLTWHSKNVSLKAAI